MSETSLKAMLAETFTRRVEASAQGLRDLADDIERRARSIETVPRPGATSAAAVAGDIIHAVMWGLANAKTDGIVSAAAEYDFHMGRQVSGE